MEIWRVARAATAAPFYFSELKIISDSEEEMYYSDGGFGHTNNPTLQGIWELETLHRRGEGENVTYGSIGVIVSIGTARRDNNRGGRSTFQQAQEAFRTATDPQHVAEVVNYNNRSNCWRFNDESGLNIELDDWKPGNKSGDLMKAGFYKWLANWDNADRLRACARELVRRRRSRTRNASKWERFATVAEFRCHPPTATK